jgi:hypothetical protein
MHASHDATFAGPGQSGQARAIRVWPDAQAGDSESRAQASADPLRAPLPRLHRSEWPRSVLARRAAPTRGANPH